ncbi:glycoside hydrolase family 3 protein [Taibaiella koreensis]|uniref:glycoside hydrolase family 3 protein n=1 Tax=Taibaiella koreensis TaxID=1268548 RepID=UPI000E59DF9B|nr:glycoside hydrolase family 3 N-terminal domain-containing protein [Taibaiella koreensis]
MKYLLQLLCLLLLTGAGAANAQRFQFKGRWIDSVYQSMSETERIGQLFMVAAYSGGDKANQDKIVQLVKNRQIGGVIFMQGNGEAQAKMTNHLQKISRVPLLIGMDAEWGLGMRLTGVKNLPKQMMIGATRDTALMYAMGSAIADQCRRLGVHIDFAPVVDINNNPRNPVINFRSFGDDKEWVARLGIAYMKGLQDKGIMACAKHFPGHGDVAVDSHQDLPVIKKSREQLEETEFFPFRQMIAAGVQSVMIAHLSVPALDDSKNLPTTLSSKVIEGVLRKDMHFGGLIFTDALDMKGLTKYYPDGETDLKAFLAGNDVLLFSQNVPLAISKIQWALRTGKIADTGLETRVKRILEAKYEAGLYQYRPVKEHNVTADLNKSTDELKEKIARAAITLVRDQGGLLSKIKAGAKVSYININGSSSTYLYHALKKNYPALESQNLPKKSNAAQVKAMIAKLKDTDVIVVGIHELALYPGKDGYYGLDATQISALQQLSQKKNVIFAILGNAYMMKNICNAKSVLVGYEDDTYTEEAAYEVLTGKLKAKGRLPVKPCAAQAKTAARPNANPENPKP